ncbi:hypothetical protein Tco_1065131 [Tanacetum coccineum]
MFKNSCSAVHVELRKQIDGRLYNLKKDVASQDSKHRQTLGEVYNYQYRQIRTLEYEPEISLFSPGDLMELSPLFSDDSRVAEAASIAQKLPDLLISHPTILEVPASPLRAARGIDGMKPLVLFEASLC